jgi:hypothetical protein
MTRYKSLSGCKQLEFLANKVKDLKKAKTKELEKVMIIARQEIIEWEEFIKYIITELKSR